MAIEYWDHLEEFSSADVRPSVQVLHIQMYMFMCEREEICFPLLLRGRLFNKYCFTSVNLHLPTGDSECLQMPHSV